MRQHSAMIRERVLTRVLDMLEHLRIQVSMLPRTEIDLEALKKLERPQQYDMGVTVAACVMAELGYESAPEDPRFDKTRRAMNEQLKKGPRRLTATTMRGDDDAQA